MQLTSGIIPQPMLAVVFWPVFARRLRNGQRHHPFPPHSLAMLKPPS